MARRRSDMYGSIEHDTRSTPIGGQTSGRGSFARGVNVSDGERVGSAIAGGALVAYGLGRGAGWGWLLTLVGGALAWRGLTGNCQMYQMLGINRASGEGGTLEGNLGVKVDRSVVVDAPPERLYAIWRDFENLPRVMTHVTRVEVLDRTRSRWTVRAPGGLSITWDAEVINEILNELIAWRSVGDSVVRHAGSVHFERAPDGRATVVRVSLQYDPPAGALGHALAGLLGENADEQIREDLIAFKRAVETGELAAR